MKTIQKLATNPQNFPQILDFGRYKIRVDPNAGRGWFESEIQVGQFDGTLHFAAKRLVSVSAEMPPQVRIALERAGYEL